MSTAGAWALDPSIDINTDQGHQPHRARAQQPLDHHRGRPRDLHAGRLRAGGDRVLPGEARGARREHELRHLRPRLRRRSSSSASRSCSAASATRDISGIDAPLSPDRLIGFGDSGNWVFLWGRSGCALTGRRRTASRSRRSSSTWSRSWTPRRPSRPAPWPSGGSGRRSSAGACSAAPSTTRSSVGGPGAAAGSASSATTSDLGFGYVDFAGSGVVHAMGGIAALAGAVVLGARIGKYGADGKPRTLAAHSIPMAMLGHVHPAVRVVRLQRRIDLRGDRPPLHRGRRQHRASRRRSVRRSAMFYCMKRMGKPDPGMMVQRHARRPRGHHRAVRVRAAVGGGGHRRHRGGASSSRPCSSSSARASTTRSVRSRCTASAACSVCCASASSPTASTAPAGTSPTRLDHGRQGHHRHPVRQRQALRQRLLRQARLRSARGAGDRVPRDHLRHGRHRLRVLQDPEHAHEGRHPSDRRGRRSAAWTCRRWASSPTTTCVLNELDIVGIEEDIVLSGGPSQDPTIGR